jgi:ABC-type multidrug transport system fused ATPase/permease subunit
LLLLAVGLIFLSHQGKAVLTSAGSYLMLSAAQKMGLQLRVRLLRHLDTLSADYYEATSVGTVLYPFQEPIDEISYFGSDLLPAILRAMLTTGSTIATMFVLSPTLTVAILPLIPAFLLARQYFRGRLMQDSDSVQADRLALSAFLEEHLSFVIPIQLLGQSRRQERRAFQKFARSARSQQRLFRSGVSFTVATSLSVALSVCAVIGSGGWKVLTGALSVGGLVAFYSFVMQLFEPLSGAAELYARAQKVFASIRQVQATLALRPAIENSPVATRLSRDSRRQFTLITSSLGMPGARTRLAFLHFALRLVKNSSSSARMAQEKVPWQSSWHGFTTCMAARSILEKRTFETSRSSLRKYVCYVPRDPVLFNGTLASNLRFIRPAASDHELSDAVIP